MANNLLWSILLFFIQPLFIFGLIYAFMTYRRRVNYARTTFRVNFVREKFEIKNFLLKGILPGVILSVLAIGLGVPFTFEWFILYQVVTAILLMIGGYRLIHPVFTFSLTSIALYVLSFLNIDLPFDTLQPLFQFNQFTYGSAVDVNQLIANTIFIASLILFASVFIIKDREETKMFPILRTSKRGKNVAKYQKKTMWLIPLMVVVPGEAFEAFADWWPLFEINGEPYAFLFMPLLVGFHFTVSTQLIHEATAQIRKEFRYVALLGLALFALAYFVPQVAVWSAGLLFIISLVVLIRHRRRENQWAFRYGPTNEGVRVIAVRSDSPAERMALSVGDMILEINDQEMNEKEDYNRVLAYNRSYIKMRIRRTDGEIIIAQTPLYDDDFNNLGLLILDN